MERKNRKINKDGDFSAKGFWVRLWKLLAPSHQQIVRLFFVIVFLELVQFIGPYILKFIIDAIANFEDWDLKNIIFLAGLLLVSNQVVSWTNYFVDKKVFNILVDSENYLLNNAHRKMVFLDLNYHEKENTGNKITKVQRGADKIAALLGNVFWDVVPTIFQIIFTAIILFIVDWRFGAAVIFFVPIFVYLTMKLNKEVFPLRKKRFDDHEKALGIMAQSIVNINTVKSFVMELGEYSKFRKMIDKVSRGSLIEFGKVIKMNIGRNLIIDLGRVSILIFGIFLVIEKSITVGSLVFVFTISEKALISLYRISRLYDRIMESSESVERLYALSCEEPEIKNIKNGIKPKNIEGKISFKNVEFFYRESGFKALDGVDFEINSGCVTALVGPSGGGKTTVARMIYRHYDPVSGEILLDGKNLKDYDLYCFRKFISIVPQEVEVFNTTVRENIAYANADVSFDQIQAAARIANAQEFIDQLRDGYDTMVGERGIKLSGGQRQRLGIARAILANPKILIFDEATSSLDSYSERLIQDAMEKIRKNRTVIVIAHRLSTIKKADKIVVLEHGKVVEQGSHYELAKEGGIYQKLLKLQEIGDVD